MFVPRMKSYDATLFKYLKKLHVFILTRLNLKNCICFRYTSDYIPMCNVDKQVFLYVYYHAIIIVLVIVRVITGTL